MNELNKAPFRRVLHRPQLFMGGEREPTMSVLVLAGVLAINGMNLVAFAIALVLWLASIPIFRAMAKSDPLMTRVYRRHIRYRGYYSARSRPSAGESMSAHRQWAILIGTPVALITILIICMVA